MSSEFTVRPYEAGDADSVWAVHEAAFRASPLPFVEDAPADRPLRDVPAHYPDGTFLVCVRDDEVVATGGIALRDDGATAEIRHVRVHPAHQRRGYGSRLLDTLESRAKRRSVQRFVLETSDRLTAARAFYEDRGYAVTGRTTDPETGVTLVQFEKEV